MHQVAKVEKPAPAESSEDDVRASLSSSSWASSSHHAHACTSVLSWLLLQKLQADLEAVEAVEKELEQAQEAQLKEVGRWHERL